MNESGIERAEKAVETVLYGTVGLALYMRDTAPSFLKLFVARGKTELQQHRKTVEEQLGQARAAGESAAAQGGPQILRLVGDNLGRLRDRAEEVIAGLGMQPGGRPGSPDVHDADEPYWHEPEPHAPPPRATEAPVFEPPAYETPTYQPPVYEPPAYEPRVHEPPVHEPVPPVATAAEPDPTSWHPEPAAASGDATPAPAGLAPGGLAIPDYDELSASQVVDRLEGLPAHELGAIRDYELGHRARNTILAKIDQLTR